MSSPTFDYITVKNLHPTFGAEISGVDFSKPLSNEVFGEIFTAAKKVVYSLLQDIEKLANHDASLGFWYSAKLA